MSALGFKEGDDCPIVPLVLNYEVCEVPENVRRNIRATLQTGYKPFNSLLSEPHDRVVSVCGFGPSFKDTYRLIEGDIWACNGAHNWLIDKGIIPKFGMFWDAAEVVSKFVKPHKDVTYLVASRCHRSVFEALEGCNVVVWHAAGDECLEELLNEFNRKEPMLHGGTASVTRSMVVAMTMGYMRINLFGADSSYQDEHTHVLKSVVEERPLRIRCLGEWFNSTAWLAGQVEDFRLMAPDMVSQGAKLKVYGTGLLPHLAKSMDFEVIA